jgi:hypothetical protein
MLCVTFSASPMTVTHALLEEYVGAVFLRVNCRKEWKAAGCGCRPGNRLARFRMGRQCPSDESGSQPFRVCTASHDPQPFGVSAKQTGYDDNPRRQGRSIFGANSAQLVPKTLRQTSVHRSANSLCGWITESCDEVKSSAQITTLCALEKYGSSHWPAVLSILELLRCRECRCT